MCTKMDMIASILAWKISYTVQLIQENIAHFGGGDNGWIVEKITVFSIGGVEVWWGWGDSISSSSII